MGINICLMFLTLLWQERIYLSLEIICINWNIHSTLLKELGVNPGDRVAFLGLNSNACFESYWSPALIGASMVPVNYRLAVREMIECVQDCSPVVLIVDPNFLDHAQQIKESCLSLISIVSCGEIPAPEGMVSYEDRITEIIASESYAELTPSSDDDTVIIFYTGGTTGRSKGVMLSHVNFKYNTECSIPLYRMQQHWTFLVIGPLFHLAAGSRVFSSTALGGHAVILPKFDVVELMRDVEKYAINSATLVPTMYQMILDHPEFVSSKIELILLARVHVSGVRGRTSVQARPSLSLSPSLSVSARVS